MAGTTYEERLETYEEVKRLLSDPEQQLEPPKAAHIIKTEPGETATAKILEARVLGTPVEALCGLVFVPDRDPRTLPLCEACKAFYELDRAFNDGLNESVGE